MKQIPERLLVLLLFTISACLAQQTSTVDYLRIEAKIKVDRPERTVTGSVVSEFKVLKNCDSVYLNAVNMKLIGPFNNTDISIEQDEDKLWFVSDFKKDSIYRAYFKYTARPRQALYFTGQQVWSQGQGKYTSHWLPSLDDMNDKIEFDLSFEAPPGTTVVSNGHLERRVNTAAGMLWEFDMRKPMSSYLVAVAMGDFKKETRYSASGIPVELYYRPADSLKVEPTYRHTIEIFDFLEKEIGLAYPWSDYKQVPVRDFLYAGMENTTATIFSQAFVVDSIGFNDRNYVNVNAHELAHQWFGNLVTETSGTHHWLQEGFATYYAQLAERAIFGDDYFYWKLYQSAEQLKDLSDQGKGESLLFPGASSITFYEKGAWALHTLRELVGDDAFRSAIKGYLRAHSFSNVDTSDFIEAVKAETTVDLTSWERDWLLQSAFPSKVAFDYLSKSPFMTDYFALVSLRKLPFSQRINGLSEAIDSGNDYLGQEAVYQLAEEPVSASYLLYKRAMETNNIYLRQAVVTSAPEIVEPLMPYLEEALKDASYLTREYALLRLWSANPSGIGRYLEALDGQLGFHDLNIRQLWLALAIYAKDFRPGDKERFKNELRGYAGPAYSFEVRQKAFEYLTQLGMVDADLLDALLDAAVHHNWRFRSSARERLESLLETGEVKKYFLSRLDGYSDKEKTYLKTALSI